MCIFAALGASDAIPIASWWCVCIIIIFLFLLANKFWYYVGMEGGGGSGTSVLLLPSICSIHYSSDHHHMDDSMQAHIITSAMIPLTKVQKKPQPHMTYFACRLLMNEPLIKPLHTLRAARKSLEEYKGWLQRRSPYLTNDIPNYLTKIDGLRPKRVKLVL